jgi:hypothetical protein
LVPILDKMADPRLIYLGLYPFSTIEALLVKGSWMRRKLAILNSLPLVVVVALTAGCTGRVPDSTIRTAEQGSGGESGSGTEADGGTNSSSGATGQAGSGTAGSGTAGNGATGSGGASGSGGAKNSQGGSKATAGNGGRGGAPVNPASDCDGIGEVGEWERLTVPNMPNPGEYVLDPRNPGTLYIGDSWDGQGFYKSTDCGATWEHVSTGRNSDKLASGRCTTLHIDRYDGTLYSNSLYGANGVYKSSNGGVDWDIVTPPADQGFPDFVGHLDMDPADPLHLLALFHTTCNGFGSFPGGVGCFAETRDGGATWTPHYNNNPSFPSEVMVYLLTETTWVAAANAGDAGLLRTENAGGAWAPVSSTTGGGHSARAVYRAKNGAYYFGGTSGIVRAEPGTNGGSWTLLPDTGTWNLAAAGNGKTMWVAGQQGVRTSPEDDGITWTLMPGSPTHSDGCTIDPNTFDHDHNVLYVSCFGDGLWRVRTE